MSRLPQPHLAVSEETFAAVMTLHSAATHVKPIPIPIVKSGNEAWTLWLIDTTVIGCTRGHLSPLNNINDVARGTINTRMVLGDAYLYKCCFSLEYIQEFLGNLSKDTLEKDKGQSDLVKAIIYNLQLAPYGQHSRWFK